MKNIAAPYAAAAPTAPTEILTVVTLLLELTFCSLVLNNPLFEVAALELAALPLPVPVAVELYELPGRMGILGLM